MADELSDLLKAPLTSTPPTRGAALGSRLKKARIHRGLTQKVLAKRAEIAQSNYHALEKGRREPSCGAIRRLCIVLNISADYLLDINNAELREDNSGW